MEKQLNDGSSFSRDQGKAYWFDGALMEVKATSEDTNGVFSLIEALFPPGYEIPLHFKRNEDDIFYVLEGDVTFTLGDKIIEGSPGTFLYAPRNIKHKFKIGGSSPAKLLIMFTPGGVEQFFIESGVRAESLQLPPGTIKSDMEKSMAVAQKYGVEILG